MAESASLQPAIGRLEAEVAGLLADAPSYRHLDERTRKSLAESLAAVTRAMASGTPLGQSLAGVDDLRNRMGGQGGSGDDSAPAGGIPATTQDPNSNSGSTGAAGGSTPGSGSPTSRVGDVARATLNAIDFPAFVAGLISGTFHAIVDASIQQMEAYAELLKNVAMTVDKFMGDNITEESARDYVADQYDGVFARDTSAGDAKLVVRKDAGADGGEMPSFLQDLGFKSPDDIDDEAINQVVVPAARRNMAQARQQTLATMVLMGINRILVDDGEIDAKLQFHVDASEQTKIKFDQTKTTNGTISGRAGRNPFSANAIMVNTVNLNTQSDLNVRADLTGEVRVKFRSEAFPLERFADSAAIQLINQNAKVPAPVLSAGPASAGPGAASTPATAAPIAPIGPTNPSSAPVGQSLGVTDPWMRA